MNPSQYNTQKHQVGTMEYAAQRELAGRLAFLNGFIGSPVAASTLAPDRDWIKQPRRRGNRIRGRAITIAITKAWQATVLLCLSLLEKRRQRYILRQSITQLRALDDRILRDIGMVRGDITALAAGTVTGDEVDQNRFSTAGPEMRLASSSADAKPASPPVSGHCTALVDRAA